MSIEQITLSNVGPIEHVSIPFPAAGKIVVLRGRNGTGKTTAIEHVENAMTGRGKGNIRDGAVSGSVEAFGVTLKLGRSTRRSGELCVESLDGKLNISDLIDPGFKDPKAADATRIKALVQIANVLPCPDLFYPLVGGREALEAVAGKVALESDDLVTMAERIKRDLEAAARREEDQASHAEGRARGAKEAATGIDVSACSDAALLQDQLEDAIRQESRIKSEREAAVKAKRAQQLARDQLDDAEAGYGGLTLAAAIEAEEKAKAAQVAAEGPAKVLADRLKEAKHDHQLTAQAKQTTEADAKRTRKAEESCKHGVTSYQRDIEAARRELARLEQALAYAEAMLMTVSLEAEELAAKAIAAEAADTKAGHIVLGIQVDLSNATRANELACQAVASSIVARKSAEAHEASMAQWRKQVAESQPVEPTAEEAAEVAEAVAKCRAACDSGVLIRRAKEHLAESERHVATASHHRKAAQKLRDAAKGTDDVLSEIVSKSGSQLRVEQGRLVLDTPRRGKTFFHELSAGEKARIAVDIGIEAMPVGKPGVITLSQEIWEGMDGFSRNAIGEHIAWRGVGILTAEASMDNDIVAEVYEPSSAGAVA